jgi:vacuolar-type H+-ATPase subunit H
MERVNQDLWDTRDEVLQSAIKAEKLTKEQVEALSEALHALQEAAKHTKDAARATKTERESISSHGTKTQENLKREL